MDHPITRKPEIGRFWCIDTIFEQEISGKALIVYVYLCRCADSEGRCFPSYRKIRENCKIKTNATVSKVLKELYSIGLVEKKEQKRKDGGKTSNLYLLYDRPTKKESTTPDQPNTCPTCGYKGEGPATPPLETLENTGDSQIPQIGESGFPKSGNLGIQTTQTQTDLTVKKSYGEFNNVLLTEYEYNRLIQMIGHDNAKYYISRLDTYIESSGKYYKRHYATMLSWSDEDKKKNKGNSNPDHKPQHKNKFNNFKGREWDHEEIERLERELLLQSVGESPVEEEKR